MAKFGGKAIALATAVVLTLTGLVGCSNSSSEQTKSNAQESSVSASDTSAVSANEGGDFKVWMPPFGSEDVSDKTFWSEKLNPLLEKEGKNLSLEVVPWSNYEEKYLTAITAGEGPDVGYMYMEMMSSYINMDVLEPLDSYFTADEKANYVYIDKGLIQGKQYALPIVVGNVSVLFCNTDILSKSGFTTPPKTWDDLITYAQKIAKDSPDIYPFIQQWAEPSIGGLNDAFYPYLWQAGGNIFNADNTKLTLDTPEALEAAQFMYDLKFKYKILPDSVTSIKNADIKSLMTSGKTAMAVGGTSMSTDLDKAGIKWDYVTSLTNKQGGTFCAADSLVMLKTTSNKELAAKVMKLMTSAPVMEEFHKSLYSAPPISKNEKYCDNAKFEKMYKEDSASFRTLAPVAGSDKIYDSLYKNLQLMMLDQATPEQALKDSVTYSETVLTE